MKTVWVSIKQTWLYVQDKQNGLILISFNRLSVICAYNDTIQTALKNT